MIKVGIIGSTGYAGQEIVRILLGSGDRMVWIKKLYRSEVLSGIRQHVPDRGCKVYG